ncbi:MAG: hypothetical protein U1E38_03745 [Rhodospirillales bacterium]
MHSNQASGEPAASTSVSLAAATLQVADIALARQGDGALSLSLQPTLDVERPALVGSAEAGADRLVAALARVAVSSPAPTARRACRAPPLAPRQRLPLTSQRRLPTPKSTLPQTRPAVSISPPRLARRRYLYATALGLDLTALAVQLGADGKMAVNGQGQLRAEAGEAAPPTGGDEADHRSFRQPGGAVRPAGGQPAGRSAPAHRPGATERAEHGGFGSPPAPAQPASLTVAGVNWR